MNVTIYTTPTCGYCRHAKEFLRQRGIQFTECDVSVDRAGAEEMVRKSGQMSVPVIVIDDEVVVGFDRARLEQLLNSGSNSQRPHFGLTIADASKTAPKFGLAPVFGALVGKVAPQSLGEKAGIQPGDIITEFNMRPIHNAGDLEKAIAALTRGQRAVIILLRGQKALKSEISL
jgi:glutaredoxin 3